jgi:phytanoyl-CoA hydroxylase
MKDQVTPEEVACYQCDGFIVFEDFLTPAELEDWRGALDEAIAQRRNRALPGRWEREKTDWVERMFIQRLNLWMDCPRMSRLITDERLGRLAATLAGIDGIRIWHDQALIKPPWGSPTDWHMDNPYWSFTSPDAISLWVALDDVTPENGCLYFMPASHKVEVRENPALGQGMGRIFESYPELASRDPVCAAMKAGSASFHNGRTFHAAQANMTPRPRRAMTCAYMPDGSTFNGNLNVLPEEYASTLAVGDVIDDDRFVPLVWRAR